ncbi:hypothetical protein FACS189419_01870 [Planctomycetales bacterium]|nr:hypothetical protein FACS189419_01870 [Planctomycetales bacterium]
MYQSFFVRITVFSTLFLATAPFLLADDPPSKPVWVLPYTVLFAFLAAGLIILLSSSKRRDTAFSDDELHEQKEEAMREIKGVNKKA